jgi:predicted enzyme related to lactoylglutathione lyase
LKRTPTPRLYRVLVPAKDLETARRFYDSLLSTRARRVGGGRIYYDAGPVILGVLDYSGAGSTDLPSPTEALYFASRDLEGVFRRARKLGCLTPGLLHGDPASPLGEIVVRPWGERSFYANDPSGNPLCFVDERTLFTGTPHQVRALRRSYDPPSRKRRTRKRTNKVG